jgi:hypothetical protein
MSRIGFYDEEGAIELRTGPSAHGVQERQFKVLPDAADCKAAHLIHIQNS